MRSISWHVRITVLLLATGLVWACGNEGDGGVEAEGVHAINLDTGESREFDMEALVPAGWAVCSGADCTTIPSRFSCNMMGPGACLLNAECRLRLRCDIDIPLWLRPAEDVGGGDGQQSDPLPAGAAGSAGVEGSTGQVGFPVGCELVCSPKAKLSCDEIQNPDQCRAQPECQWETSWSHKPWPYPTTDASEAAPPDPDPGVPTDTRDGAPAPDGDPACGPDDASCLVAPVPPPVPLVYTQVCRDRRLQACEELDSYACARRDDCLWLPEPLPLFEPVEADACSGASCEPSYRSFCRPKVEPVCPPVRLAMPVCQDGQRLVKEFDDKGRCLIGHKCAPPCPLRIALDLVCEDGEVRVRRLDGTGCGYVRCEPVECPDDVTKPKPMCPLDSGPEPVIKDGCIVDYTCGPVCPPLPPKPQGCEGKLTGLYSGSCLMGWSCSDPLDPAACRELAAAYDEALQAAKQCPGDTGGTGAGSEPGFAAPVPWLGTCSTTVASFVGCGCPTYVNPANREALAKLNEIRAAFGEGQCFRNWACLAVMCYAPSGAACEIDSSGKGLCKDGPAPL